MVGLQAREFAVRRFGGLVRIGTARHNPTPAHNQETLKDPMTIVLTGRIQRPGVISEREIEEARTAYEHARRVYRERIAESQ
jgi:hypothetical protein